MPEKNVTRRRVMQGAGVIGITGLLGTASVSAQEDTATPTTDGETAAVRIAHASADAPNVDVRLTSEAAADEETPTEATETEPAEGTETEATEATATEAGEATETEPAEGTETEATEATTTEAGEGTETEAASEPVVEVQNLAFGEVTDYQEIDPGAYTLQIVATDGGLLDQIADIFGGGGGDETVIYEDTVDVAADTAYTAVAFGEVGAGPAKNGQMGPPEETETPDGEETETPEGEETETVEAEQAGPHKGMGPPDTGFQVEILVDDLTAPGEDTARVRLFHAVPDVRAVTITSLQADDEATAAGNETATDTTETAADGGTEAVAGNQPTDGAGYGEPVTSETLVEGLMFGESQTVEVPAGSYTLRVAAGGPADGDGPPEEVPGEGPPEDVPGEGPPEELPGEGENATDEAGNETEEAATETEATPTDEESPLDEDAEDVREVQATFEGDTAYTGLAIGYFDPSAAAEEDEEMTETEVPEETETAAGEETETAAPGETEAPAETGTETAAETETEAPAATATETEATAETDTETAAATETEAVEAADVESREFELVVVQDTQAGERSAGGNQGML